ncbi:hypothetical protein L7F22_041408 [Adiantum nelumboides]|nr:hypothetical protein [Adiantum nelumboides]
MVKQCSRIKTVRVQITKDIIYEALHFYPRQHDLLTKTKSMDNEKAFIKAKGNKYKYNDMIYKELELPLRPISQHIRVQNPPRYTEAIPHIAIVMALVVAENRTIRCDYGRFILESLVEANLKGATKNKLYMRARPMLTKIAYQALGMIEDLPMVNSQTTLIQNAKLVARFVRTTTTATSSRATRSTKKSSSDDEKVVCLKRTVEQAILEPQEGEPKRQQQEEEENIENIQMDSTPPSPKALAPPASPPSPKSLVPPRFILESPVEANLKGTAKNKLYMRAGPMLTRIAYQALGMIEDLPMANSQIALIQNAKLVARPVRTTTTATSSKATRSTKKILSDDEKADTDKERIPKVWLKRTAEQAILESQEGEPMRQQQEEEENIENIQMDSTPPSPKALGPPASPPSPKSPVPPRSPPPPVSTHDPISPQHPKSPAPS